jgi:hypothetical protein
MSTNAWAVKHLLDSVDWISRFPVVAGHGAPGRAFSAQNGLWCLVTQGGYGSAVGLEDGYQGS